MANRFLSNIRINDAYTFPASDGSADQVIATDGAGNLSFQSVADIAGNPEANFVYYNVKNSSGSTIAKGAAVMAVGTDGNSGHILIDEMVADGTVEPKYFIGVLETQLTNGGIGRVIHFGELDQINTLAFQNGDILWCDPSNPGGFTVTEPVAPNVKIAPAIVINSATNGKIKVRVQGNEGLHELHDVKIVSSADKDLLVWNNTGSYWENSKTIGDITTGNITTSGTVDGVDVSAFKASYDVHTHDDRYYTETEVDALLTNSTNWDTAYSWGDHSTAGYAEDYTVSYISTNTNAAAGNLYVFTATLTLTLPASPSTGDKIAISNMSGTTTPIIARNGNLLVGLSEDLTIDVDNIGLQFVYSGATKGWILI